MPTITVLDAYTLNPGDLSWDALQKLGDCHIYDRSSDAEVLLRAQEAEILLINKIRMNRKLLQQLPKLKYIGVLATGYNVVDISAAQELGIVVTNIPSYGTLSVAQMVFAHLLNLTQKVAHHAQAVQSGRWGSCPDFCFWDSPLIELHGLTLGIIGCGRIGRETAKIGRAFGMKTVGYDQYSVDDPEIRMLDMEEVFRVSDVLSLHCPLTNSNQQMVNYERLSMMKKSAFLINTSRGPLIDEEALAAALNEGRLAGAGLDVLGIEPPGNDNPLLNAKNCFVTPHISWATRSARSRLLDTAVANVQSFLRGQPANQVS
ncbi:MAG: D-2-hydroxyacid dehydrogenase [Lentisphaeria bacterium]